jgi:hypothetical protein
MVGLPETGKTTFLAAFWQAVYEAPANSPLRLHRLPSEREYLEEIRNSWLKFEPIPHTAVAHIAGNEMELSDRNDANLDLRFPDLFGEVYEHLLLDRACPIDLRDLLTSADGLLVFVHPDRIRQSPRIDAVNALEKALQSDAKEATENATTEVEEPAEFDAAQLPVDTQMVDLIQLLLDAAEPKRISSVCVVVSAWDRAASESLAPGQWLERRLPLFAQYVTWNDKFRHSIFGISAQGGRLVEDAEKLQSHLDPLERIVARDSNGQITDITAPVRWLVG